MVNNQMMARVLLTMEDIEKLRRTIKIGDTLKAEVMRYVPGKETFFVKKIIKVVVVAKYPHLVHVVPKKYLKSALPEMTMTYTEIAMIQRGLTDLTKGENHV